jgi:N-methylhydantoinase A
MREDTVRAAFGVHRLVNVQIAEGIRTVTVREGHDPRRFTLLAGGGAAGMHAVTLARELGIPRVVVPRLAPVISALGLLATDVRHELVGACVGELGTMSVADIQRVLEGLVEEGNRRLASGGITDRDRVLDFSVDLLYGNQVYPLTVPLEDTDLLSDNWPSCLRSRFEAIYCARYGYDQPDQPVQARAIRLTAIGRLQRPQLATSTPGSARSTGPIGERPVYLGEWVPASVYVFEDLVPGERFSGPAVEDGNYTTVLLPPGCHAEVDPWGGLIIHVS